MSDTVWVEGVSQTNSHTRAGLIVIFDQQKSLIILSVFFTISSISNILKMKKPIKPV